MSSLKPIRREFEVGDKIYYGSWSYYDNSKGGFIMAKGIIRKISYEHGIADVERTDRKMPIQKIDITRLKKEK